MSAHRNLTIWDYINGGPARPLERNATTWDYINGGPARPLERNATTWDYINRLLPTLTPVESDGSELLIPECEWRLWPENDAAKIVVPYGEGERNDSAVLLDDGRVLYVFVDDIVDEIGQGLNAYSVKQGYAPSVDALLNEDGSVEDISTIITGGHCQSCAFRAPNGELMLITDARGSGYAWGSTCWVSPSGMGGDWIFRGRIQNATLGESVRNASGNKSIGQPYFYGSRWVLSLFWWREGYDGIKWPAIWTSDNHGYTWTRRHEQGYHIAGGPYGMSQTRNFGEYNGRLFWVAAGHPGIEKNTFYSDDGGITWIQGTAEEGNWNFGIRDNEFMYRIGGSGNVDRTPLPPGDTSGPWEAWRNYIGMGTGNGQIVQKLGDRIVYMHDGKVLGMKCPPGGWRISVVE